MAFLVSKGCAIVALSQHKHLKDLAINKKIKKIIFANKSASSSESTSELSSESSSETPTCLLSFDEPSILQLLLISPE
jgi:hypothetical protein